MIADLLYPEPIRLALQRFRADNPEITDPIPQKLRRTAYRDWNSGGPIVVTLQYSFTGKFDSEEDLVLKHYLITQDPIRIEIIEQRPENQNRHTSEEA